MPQGYKICDKCGEKCGPRSFECKTCGNAFKMNKFRKSKRKIAVSDWKELEKGSKVRVIGGSGPYYVMDDGERRYLTSRGVYIVTGITNEGLHVESEAGYTFLWMTDVQKSPLCHNLWRAPHKLRKVL